MAEQTHWWIERWLKCRAIYLFFYLSVYLSVCLSICLSVYLSVYLSVCLFICLFASLKTTLFCETSSKFRRWNLKNEAFLRDFLNYLTWKRQERSFSARLLQSFNLTASKTKRFCETSFAPQQRAMCYLPSGQMAPNPPLSEPILRPCGATKHWKTQCFVTFPPFQAPASSFF